MKKYFPLLAGFILLAICLDMQGQQSSIKYRKMFDVTDYKLVQETASTGAFYISVKPVTNRDYITYLCWLCVVYKDYPEVFMRAFPGIESATLSDLGGDFYIQKDLPKLINSIEIAREYIFNPTYINYSVTGITWNQAMNFMSWMTDRYNEMSLIRNKELHYDPNQLDEKNFNTEAYIFLQYEGVVNRLQVDRKTGKEMRSDWSSRLFYPSFRLPSSTELKSTGIPLKCDFVAYKPEKFLEYWMDMYTAIKKDTLILKIGNYIESEIKITVPSIVKMTDFPTKPAEFTLDYGLNKKLTDILDIFKEYGQDVINEKSFGTVSTEEKNNLGQMPFVIIGEDKNSNPVYIKRAEYKREVPSDKFTVFRFAMGAVR